MPIAALTSPNALRRFARQLIIANVVVLLILAMTASLALFYSRAAYTSRALSTAENLARIVSLSIGAEIKQVDNALSSAILETRRQARGGRLDPAQVARIADEQRALVPQVDTIRLTDAEGWVINNPQGAAPVSLADRAYFKAAQAAPERLVMSEPLQGRIIKKWGVILARARIGGEGQFEGIAYSGLTADHFEAMFDDVAVGRHGAVTLRSEQLHIVARFAPGAASAASETGKEVGNATASPELAQARASEPEHGAYINRSAVDGIERVSAYQRVPGYPLLVLVGLGTEESYAPWHQEVAQLAGMSTLLEILIIGGSLLLYRQRRKQLLILRQLAALTAEQQALLDNDLVSMARFRSRIISWHNRALANLFGYESQDMRGRPARMFYLNEADYEEVGRGYTRLAAGQHFRTQLQMLRGDGRVIWIDLSAVRVSEEESLWMMVDITAVKESESQARHVAMHDGLTGLGNRLQLPLALDQALRNARETGRGLAVCYIDLDGFKAVNDSHGHGAGDELLRVVAQRMTHCVRGEDSLIRMGGDEFVIVLKGLGERQEIEPVLQRLLAALQRSFVLEQGVEVNISASIGVAICPESGDDAESLMACADKAMYEAKRAGKNRLVFHSSAA